MCVCVCVCVCVYIYIYIYTHVHIYSFENDTALCWAEILKLLVNSLARFIQKRTGNCF